MMGKVPHSFTINSDWESLKKILKRSPSTPLPQAAILFPLVEAESLLEVLLATIWHYISVLNLSITLMPITQQPFSFIKVLTWLVH